MNYHQIAIIPGLNRMYNNNSLEHRVNRNEMKNILKQNR